MRGRSKMIDFDKIKEVKIENFKGGKGFVIARIYDDGNNKIMKATLQKDCSIGMHTHDNSSEIIYVFNGNASCVIDGKKEIINKGKCHYCPKGSTHSIKNENDEDLVMFCVVTINN